MGRCENSLWHRLRRRLSLVFIKIYQKLRVFIYGLLSNVDDCNSAARFNQPVLMTGRGKVRLGTCNFGFWPSPYYLNGYAHLEVRNAAASIEIGDGVWVNNNAVFIAERSSIRIGDRTLIGTEFTVYDSDFHDLRPGLRTAGNHECIPVVIGKDVFIGSRVMVMKGVSIGDNCVVASGSVVTSSFPANCVVGGVPAKLIRHIEGECQ